MDTQLFNEVIGEVPPSTVDVEAAITRSRRAARIRRMANPVVAAGVAVVLLTGAVAYTMTRGDGGGSGVGVGGEPTSTSSETPAETPTGTTKKGPSGGNPPEACSRTDLESGDEVETRLSGVAKAAVQAQRSDLQVVANSFAEYPDDVAHGPLDFYQVTGEKPVDRPICHEDSYFMGSATTKGPEGEGNILIVVQPDYFDGVGMGCAPPGGEETFCEQVTGPNGETIVKKTLALEGGTTMNRIDMERPDGTDVMVSVEDIATTIKSGGPPTASELPLTLDQLIAIGTDPGMTLFP